jgi:V/A-type H+-transporting ATPase subunit K
LHHFVRVGIVAFAALAVFAAPAAAQEEAAPAGPLGTGAGLLGLAAALAVGLGALGTAVAQARIGSAAETMIILGFLVAFFIIGRIR